MKKFKYISEELWNTSVLLVNSQQYRAHIHESFPPEELLDHMKKVCDTTCLLVEQHFLDGVIDKLVADVFKGVVEPEMEACCASWGKRLFAASILYHDFGKVNENFQVDRMLNMSCFRHKKTSLAPVFGHSFLGAYLFIAAFLDEVLKNRELTERAKIGVMTLTVFFGYTINKHHASRWKEVMDVEYLESFAGMYEELNEYFRTWGMEVNGDVLKKVFECFTGITGQFAREYKKLPEGRYADRFALFALLKLNSSLLTAADYLATHEYTSGEAVRNLGVFAPDRARVHEIIAYFRNFAHNETIYSDIDEFVPICPEVISRDHLNQLRKEMAVEVIHSMRANLDKRLFYLEAPTGGGKTNLSMIVVTELLEKHKEINKVLYVFPFTTLITQTYGSLKNSLGLSDSELVELHSKAPLHGKNEDVEDGVFGNRRKDYIDSLFALYPVSVLSHVKFFDVLKTNRKEDNYLLHRLANSVVIVDEVQSYNPKVWDKMLYLMAQYAYYFNIRFIVMSATLPKIGLLNVSLPEKVEFVDLLPRARAYLTNPNFANRVRFRFDFFKEEIDIPFLVCQVIGKSVDYMEHKSISNSVHTIVEFIFKKSASDFYRLMNEAIHPFDEVLVLSGTILEPRRREIINLLKNEDHRGKNILLITTQVVEAGVDIDMDLGFKNISLIDSDEQLAGRVNRNASKSESEVYLFRLDDARVLYVGDERYRVTRESIDFETYESILKEKDFGRLYNLVLKKIDDKNSLALVENFYSNFLRDGILKLNYEEVDKQFQIIKQHNASIFVPIRIPVRIPSVVTGKEEELFTKMELDFLDRFGVNVHDETLDGGEVWQVYENLILSRTTGFDLGEQANFKVLQSIMSKYTFSLLCRSNDYQQIACGMGVEKYGYFYLSHWNGGDEHGALYGYMFGLNSDSFNDIGFI